MGPNQKVLPQNKAKRKAQLGKRQVKREKVVETKTSLCGVDLLQLLKSQPGRKTIDTSDVYSKKSCQ